MHYLDPNGRRLYTVDYDSIAKESLAVSKGKYYLAIKQLHSAMQGFLSASREISPRPSLDSSFVELHAIVGHSVDLINYGQLGQKCVEHVRFLVIRKGEETLDKLRDQTNTTKAAQQFLEHISEYELPKHGPHAKSEKEKINKQHYRSALEALKKATTIVASLRDVHDHDFFLAINAILHAVQVNLHVSSPLEDLSDDEFMRRTGQELSRRGIQPTEFTTGKTTQTHVDRLELPPQKKPRKPYTRRAKLGVEPISEVPVEPQHSR